MVMPTSPPRWRPVAALVILIGALFLATPPGGGDPGREATRLRLIALLLAAASLYRLVVDVRDIRRTASR